MPSRMTGEKCPDCDGELIEKTVISEIIEEEGEDNVEIEEYSYLRCSYAGRIRMDGGTIDGKRSPMKVIRIPFDKQCGWRDPVAKQKRILSETIHKQKGIDVNEKRVNVKPPSKPEEI